MKESEEYEAIADYIEKHGHHRGSLFDSGSEATCVIGAYGQVTGADVCAAWWDGQPKPDWHEFADRLQSRLDLPDDDILKHSVAVWSDYSGTQAVLDGLRKAAKLARIEEESPALAEGRGVGP